MDATEPERQRESEREPVVGDGMESCGDDEESAAVLRTVGKVIKKCRERKGLTQAQLGKAIGYSEEQVSSVERGRRAPKEQFLEQADGVLDAGGMIVGLTEDVEHARYPKKVRDVKELESQAVEMGSYDMAVIDGLLQTPEYTRALFTVRRPPLAEDELERQIAGRLARQEVIDTARATPILSFVLDEAALRRPFGGRMVMHEQLEHLLDMGQARNIDIQVLPLTREGNAGIAGSFRLLRLKDGKTVGLSEVQLISRVVSDRKEIQILEMRYGIIRAQALSPGESLAFIRKVQGEI